MVVTSRFVHGSDSARPSIGGISAREPLASTTARRASKVSSPTCDRALAGDRRLAAHQRHAAVLEPGQLAGVVEVVDDLVAAPSVGLTSSEPVTASRAPGTRWTSASSSPGRSSALEGMHAQ